MSTHSSIKISLLKRHEVDEAARIVRLAFGTFLGVPNPLDFMDDRDFMAPRWRSPHVKVIAARDNGRRSSAQADGSVVREGKLIGSNVITRWGSFGYFGPLTVLPEYWERGIAQRLLEATVQVFDEWGVRHTGLYTFATSAKHVHLYQKFGYWPRYLTAVLTRTPGPNSGALPTLLSKLPQKDRANAIEACRKLTHRIHKGLDLSDEIRALLRQRTGDVVLTHSRSALDAFAICLTGPGSEGGSKVCYVKFAAARGGAGADARFAQLLDAIDCFAASRAASIEGGINLARESAYRGMRAHGYRVASQGVAMQRPHAEGFNRPDVWIIDDWR